MLSLFLRNLVFTILQPGIVAGLIPYLISRNTFSTIFPSNFSAFQYSGILIFLIGVSITIHCIGMFAVHGKGTLSPADPTQKLVTTGLYKFSRNPMYVGVMLILIGETLFMQSLNMLLYSGVVFAAFSMFIILREEPRLARDFGKEYLDYKAQVRRWV